MSRPTKQVIVVSHTHWDREWYFPFHRFRLYLNHTVRQVLDLLETQPAYRHFVLDGQAILLEDYLEIFPRERQRIERLVQAGRLSIGPWYILPDEFLVSAEATVRNLLTGDAVCSAYGRRQRVGYMPDSFGHLAQMPQILQKAGLDSFIYTRGNGEELETLGTQYLWQAPDGSSVLAINQRTGYWNAGSLGYRELWESNTHRVLDVELAVQQVGEQLEQQARFSNVEVYLFNNGSDHKLPQPQLPQLLELFRKRFPGVRFKHGSFEDYVAVVRKSRPVLKKYAGELRSGKYHFILFGVWSARMPLKQHNDRCQTLLEKAAEPLATYSWAHLGVEYPAETLDYAWKLLLKNHPHDSICGCSTDEVHREMIPRFEGVAQTAEQLIRERLETIAPYLGRNEDDDRETVLTAFNPLPQMRTEVARRLLLLAPGLDIADLELVDPRGRVVDFEILHRRFVQRFWNLELFGEIYPETQWENYAIHYLEGFPRQTVRKGSRKPNVNCFAVIQFVAQDVPALGHGLYRLRPKTRARPEALQTPPVQVARNRISNGLVTVTVHRNGSFDLLDHETGTTYRNLNLFEDGEDAGDEYDYSPAVRSQTFTTRGCRGRVSVVENSRLSGKIQVGFDFRLPRSLRRDRKARSRAQVDCRLRTRIGLEAGSKRVDVHTAFDNRAEDHRLRVLFPTPIRADTLVSDGHFYIHERPIDIPKTEGWAQAPGGTHPQQDFSLVQDGERGLAVFSRGLPEIEAVRGRSGATLALTLLRAVGWLSREDGLCRRGNAGPTIATPEAQCPGEQRFEYAVLPFGGDYLAAEVKHLADRYKSPLLLRQGVAYKSIPAGVSLLRLRTNKTAVSAVKKHRSRDSMVVRLYNLTHRRVRERLYLGKSVRQAWIVDLLENRRARIPVKNPEAVDVSLNKHEIVSVEIVFR